MFDYNRIFRVITVMAVALVTAYQGSFATTPPMSAVKLCIKSEIDRDVYYDLVSDLRNTPSHLDRTDAFTEAYNRLDIADRSGRTTCKNDQDYKRTFDLFNAAAVAIENEQAYNELRLFWESMLEAKIGYTDLAKRFHRTATLYNDIQAAANTREHYKDIAEPLNVEAHVATDAAALRPYVVYHPDKSYLESRYLDISDFSGMIVLEHPECLFSIRARNTISGDLKLAEWLNSHRISLMSPWMDMDEESLRDLQSAMPHMQIGIVERRKHWPEFADWSYPAYHYYENGKLLGSVIGWPKGNEAHQLESIRKLVFKKNDE